MKKISILGAGTWGIALAQALAVGGHEVTVWSALPEELETLKKNHAHPKLPGITLSDTLQYEAEMKRACRNKDLLLFAVPSVYLRATVERRSPIFEMVNSSPMRQKALSRKPS